MKITELDYDIQLCISEHIRHRDPRIIVKKINNPIIRKILRRYFISISHKIRLFDVKTNELIRIIQSYDVPRELFRIELDKTFSIKKKISKPLKHTFNIGSDIILYNHSVKQVFANIIKHTKNGYTCKIYNSYIKSELHKDTSKNSEEDFLYVDFDVKGDLTDKIVNIKSDNVITIAYSDTITRKVYWKYIPLKDYYAHVIR